MAYQVISQNNTTTTLADENGNVIRVPARVSLATSTDYTIKKVNNSTATLEDGNGNIIRDVPCVAVLVGGEGGGGGAVSSVNGQTGDVVITGNDVLPDQTGQSGKFLTTDGTDASWAAVNALQNTATGTLALTILGTATNVPGAINIGSGSSATNANGVAVGRESAVKGAYSLALGAGAKIGSNYNQTIQLGEGTNLTQGSFQVKSYTMMSADGTIPTDRLVHAINKYSTMPTAASTNEGWIVQFTGTTDSTYTHGHLYECVSDGQTPATYSWTEVSMGGGSGLPSQTGNAGKFLTTDGTDASWSDKPLVNTATYKNTCLSIGTANPTSAVSGALNVGRGARVTQAGGTALGAGADVRSQYGTAVGCQAYVNSSVTKGGLALGASAFVGASGAIQLDASGSTSYITNSDANTVKIANANGNFEIMSADGTIPADRHAALPAADGTYTLQLVISSGVPTLSWVAV